MKRQVWWVHQTNLNCDRDMESKYYSAPQQIKYLLVKFRVCRISLTVFWLVMIQ